MLANPAPGLLGGALNEPLLEERFSALEVARSWKPRVLSRLESLIRNGTDRELYRINAHAFGTKSGIPETEAIDLLVHAAAVGLFEMDWLLLCPMCACVVESFGSLVGVTDRYHCPMCRCDYNSTLDEFIAVTFTVSSAVRKIAFHKMSDLTAEDYCFECRMTADGLRPEGQPLAELLKSLSHGVQYLSPHSITTFRAASEQGFYFGFDVDSRAYFEFLIQGAPSTEPQTVRVRYSENGCEPSALTVAPGDITFEIENTGDKDGLLTVCSVPPGAERTKLNFVPFLTGARLLVTQSFRELFRSELIRAAEGIGVRDVTVLFTDLKGSTALYERIGDLKAFSLVQQHFDRILEVVVANNGAVIKTIGDAVMAAFDSPADAVRSGIAMREEIDKFNALRQGQDIILKIGIHRGPSIAVTLNERLDYFGQTVNIAARVQSKANGDEICMSENVIDMPGVADLLSPYAITQENALLRGIERAMIVFHVGATRETQDMSATSRPNW